MVTHHHHTINRTEVPTVPTGGIYIANREFYPVMGCLLNDD